MLLALIFCFRNGPEGFCLVPLPEDLADLEAIYTSIWLTLSFEIGVPLLAVTSFVFGVPSWRARFAQFGLMSAVSALLFYIFYMVSCTAMFASALRAGPTS